MNSCIEEPNLLTLWYNKPNKKKDREEEGRKEDIRSNQKLNSYKGDVVPLE